MFLWLVVVAEVGRMLELVEVLVAF